VQEKSVVEQEFGGVRISEMERDYFGAKRRRKTRRTEGTEVWKKSVLLHLFAKNKANRMGNAQVVWASRPAVFAFIVVISVSVRAEHHYVPRLYLKSFADENGRLSVYRLLVSHSNVREWKTLSARAIAYHSHLYTRVVSGSDSDEVEEWLGREIETRPKRPSIALCMTNS
jgi:hypothetical protein